MIQNLKADDDNDESDYDNESTLSIVPLAYSRDRDKPNVTLKCSSTFPKIPVCASEPRIVVHHHFPFFDKALSRHTISNDPLLKLLRRYKFFDAEKEMKPKIEAGLASSFKVR